MGLICSAEEGWVKQGLSQVQQQKIHIQPLSNTTEVEL